MIEDVKAKFICSLNLTKSTNIANSLKRLKPSFVDETEQYASLKVARTLTLKVKIVCMTSVEFMIQTL